MRLCRFGDNRLGLVEDAVVRDVTGALDVLPGYRYPLPTSDQLVTHLDAVLRRARELAPDAPALPLDQVTLLSPVANPGKIVAAPVNYQKHLEEVRGDSRLHHNNPSHTAAIHTMGVFLKATSSLVGPGQGIAVCKPDRRTDHEVELAFVIGKTARHVRREDALDHIAGYAIGLDITIRGPEDRSLRKSPDTYTVLGPWLVTADEIADPDVLDLEITVNGEQRQKSNTRYLIKDVRELIVFASSFYTLHPGDVVLTGTPEGVSPIVPGDEVVATIQSVGSMRVSVRAAEEPAVDASAQNAVGEPV
ncbi:MAG: fumarylacetoacetate hydrolase family protein [Acidobacteria bacterium]|nr:fumarylacetoacetate hydrolase family protein [Acidobacteriota bacterium]